MSVGAFSMVGTTNWTINTPENITDEVPTDVLNRFYESFIIDSQGNFLGAMVGEIRNYATMPEILTLVSNQGYAIDGNKVIDRHKPRVLSKGCKYNEDWICQFDDSIVD
jgi:hypothetical protein